MLIIFILLFLVLLLGSLMLFAGRAFSIKPIPHERDPAEFDIPFREIHFLTRNNRILYGWWIPGKELEKLPTLILVHGWKRNVGRMLTYIRHLYPHGFNLLAFDSRQHGSSDEDGYSTMVKFAEDIRAALEFMASEDLPMGRLGLIGLSLGGAASLYASALDDRIRTVVSVGAPAHPWDVIRYDMQQRRIPYFPLVWFMKHYFRWRLGFSMDDIAPENNIKKTKIPYLFIHGSEDITVPPEHARRLKDAAGNRGTLWMLPGRGHSDCHQDQDFWPKLINYLNINL